MNIIDHKNSDEWLFNYFEGNLNPQEKEQLITFLNRNPALKTDYDAWKKSYVNEPEGIYPQEKELLKPQALPTKTWIKIGIGIFVGISLLLFYRIKTNDMIQLPLGLFREQKLGIDERVTPKDTIYSLDIKQLESAHQAKIKGLKVATAESNKATASPEGTKSNKEKIQPFIMTTLLIRESIAKPLNTDSLEIIIKQTKTSSKAGNAIRQKKQVKKMKVIRLENPGF